MIYLFQKKNNNNYDIYMVPVSILRVKFLATRLLDQKNIKITMI
jgi:hypothetical protein